MSCLRHLLNSFISFARKFRYATHTVMHNVVPTALNNCFCFYFVLALL